MKHHLKYLDNTILCFNIFPFNIDMETVPDELKIELIDLQKNVDMKNKFHNMEIQKYY